MAAYSCASTGASPPETPRHHVPASQPVCLSHSLVHAAHEGGTLKDALGVLVLHGQQGTGSVTDLGQNHLTRRQRSDSNTQQTTAANSSSSKSSSGNSALTEQQ